MFFGSFDITSTVRGIRVAIVAFFRRHLLSVLLWLLQQEEAETADGDGVRKCSIPYKIYAPSGFDEDYATYRRVHQRLPDPDSASDEARREKFKRYFEFCVIIAAHYQFYEVKIWSYMEECGPNHCREYDAMVAGKEKLDYLCERLGEVHELYGEVDESETDEEKEEKLTAFYEALEAFEKDDDRIRAELRDLLNRIEGDERRLRKLLEDGKHPHAKFPWEEEIEKDSLLM